LGILGRYPGKTLITLSFQFSTYWKAQDLY